MDENIKSKIKAKNKLCQVYVNKNRQETDFFLLKSQHVIKLSDTTNQNMLLKESGKEV